MNKTKINLVLMDLYICLIPKQKKKLSLYVKKKWKIVFLFENIVITENSELSLFVDFNIN